MHRTAYTFFIGTLIFSPLAFGTVEQWSMATVQLLVCVTVLCLIYSLKKNAINLLKVPGILPLILLVLWIFFQVLPLPPTILQTVSPSTYDIYKPIHEVSGQLQWFPLTVNQKATLSECMRIASYGLFYFLTVQILSDGVRLKKTIRIISYLAIFIAFLAIVQKFTSPDKIYWFRNTPEGAGTVGPWVYHNHYAGFMEMMCPIVLALFLFYRPFIDQENPLRSRIAAVFTSPGSNLHFFFGFSLIVIISSIFVSLSRGGIISLCFAMVLFLLLLPRRIVKSRFALYGLLISCVVLMMSWLGWEPVIGKFAKTLTEAGTIADYRLLLWQDSLNIIGDFFLTGSGFGTFIFIYPLYKNLPTSDIYDHAHNDYLELLTDGGIIGFVLVFWFVLAIVIHGFKNIQRRRDRYAVLLSIGALTGIVSILFHSVTDFNMHNGANGLYFFFLCGLLVSAGNTRLYYRTKSSLLSKSGPNSIKVFLVTTLLLAGATIFLRGGAIFSRFIYAKVAGTYLSKNLSEEKLQAVSSTAKRASLYDPLEGKYPFDYGSTQVFLNQPKDAMVSFIEASKKNPLSGIYLQRLAFMIMKTDKDRAEKLMSIAYARALNKESLVLTWADWLLSINERKKAIKMVKKVFSDRPFLTRKFIPAISGYSFNRQEIEEMLPESIRAWIYYGDFLEKQGKIEDAEYFRVHALDFVDQEEVIKPWFFSQLFWFYYRQKKDEQALAIIRKASKKLPEHAKFHIYLGDHFKREGILYKAVEEYKQALLLEPVDEKTRRKLEELQKKR